MSDEPSPLPWTAQQWATLRGAIQVSARASRVASRFLPIGPPVGPDETTVPANWMSAPAFEQRDHPQRGEAERRLVTRSGKTLHLVTIACNVYLRASEVADPKLEAAKAMMRRAAEVLGRLEDAIIFNGLPKRSEGVDYPIRDKVAIVQPVIYTVHGGQDLTGLLEAPDTLFVSLVEQVETLMKRENKQLTEAEDSRVTLRNVKEQFIAASDASSHDKDAKEKLEQDARTAVEHLGPRPDVMSVRVAQTPGQIPIVVAVIEAVEKLENRGHFGPFAAVFGHNLFKDATTPTGTAAVLPTEQFVPFLAGGELHRSSTLPPDEGVIVALGGEAVELVLGTDMDVKFLQLTLEPRYVLRVFERFVLRIKELDAVCRLTKRGLLIDPTFKPHKANS